MSIGESLARISSPASTMEILLPEDMRDTRAPNAFLALAALSLFAWIRASQSESLQLDPATEKEIYDSFASFLIVDYVNTFGSREDPDALVHELTQRATRLMKVWNDNLHNPPAPHWYVGKEVWFMVESDRDKPDPARITAMSELLSSRSINFLAYVQEMRRYIG